MPTLLIPGFGGEVPRIEPRTLEAHQSARAVNCDLRRGSLRPLRGVRRVAEVSASARTIFKHDIDGWLVWDKDVSVVKSAVIDVIGETPLGHLLITGDRDYPTQRFAGGETYRLGIPRPETAPTVTVKAGAGIGDVSVHGFIAGSGGDMPTKDSQLAPVEGQGVAVAPIVFSSIDGIPPSTEAEKISRSSSYCYTYVQSLQNGVYQQESAPSPPSELVDVKSGDGALVSGFRLPSLSGLNITHIRIYRTVAGNETGEFRFVAEIPVSQAEYMDTAHDKDVPTDVLQTTLWDRIPDDAQGLIKTDNGIYACFRGNELLVSELFIPYAFPESYRLTVEDRIVALGHVDSTIVILTTGRPYLAQGAAPESLQLLHLPIEQPCLSARSVGHLPGGVVYACPDGLMLFTSAEQSLLTSGVFTRDQWQELGPENLVGSVLDGRYIGFFSGTNQGFILDLGRKDVVRVELPGAPVHALYHHVNDDCVYLAVGTDISVFEGGESLPYTWRSKPFFMSALTSMSALRIEGGQNRGNPVTVRLFGPGEMPRQTLHVRDTRTVRIRTARCEKLWSLELSGTAPVYEARMGASVEDLEHGSA